MYGSEALSDVKTLLGIEKDDEGQNELLNTIMKVTESRLMVLLGAEEFPEKLSYIVTEVTVARFNRIGSEGLSSHTVEGESMSWSDDDFAPYSKEIAAYSESQQGTVRTKVRFL